MSHRAILSREIGIDVGHRVPDHGSKCRNPHGHRYRVIATCEGPVMDQSGHEENGMVVDFGNIKKYMMDTIDSVFDHGFVVYKGDHAMMSMFFPDQDPDDVWRAFKSEWDTKMDYYIRRVESKTGTTEPIHLPRCSKSEQDPDGMKVIVVNYVPTAENMAKDMFEILERPIAAHYGNDTIRLKEITLYETPNGWVKFGQ